MQLTDDQLHRLIIFDPGNEALLAELRWRCRRAALDRIPATTGRCSHGHRILWDEKGVYSSGYPIHMTEDGRTLPGYCHAFKTITNDPPPPITRRMRALAETLR